MLNTFPISQSSNLPRPTATSFSNDHADCQAPITAFSFDFAPSFSRQNPEHRTNCRPISDPSRHPLPISHPVSSVITNQDTEHPIHEGPDATHHIPEHVTIFNAEQVPARRSHQSITTIKIEFQAMVEPEQSTYRSYPCALVAGTWCPAHLNLPLASPKFVPSVPNSDKRQADPPLETASAWGYPHSPYWYNDRACC